MLTKEDYEKRLREIPFFQAGMHPEYLPFLGEDYPKYRILQVGESHYIGNDANGQITLDDFAGWWDGKPSPQLAEMRDEWYTTRTILKNYLTGKRSKGHGIFTNALKSFCEVVVPGERFDRINDANAQKYNYFAFMNFYQMPSVYRGKNFTSSFYHSGKKLGKSMPEIDDLWYRCMAQSVAVFEAVVNALEPRAIVITSEEVAKHYERFGIRAADGAAANHTDGNGYGFNPGRLCGDSRMICVSHPGCRWWNRTTENKPQSGKVLLEDGLRRIYGK